MIKPTTMAREYTNKVVELLEEGVLSYEAVALECLSYMSEADVKDMAESNEWIEEEEEDEAIDSEEEDGCED